MKRGQIDESPGSGWVQLSFYRQRATDFYNPLGSRQPFLAASQFDTRSVFVTAAVGVVAGLELWAQVPTHNLAVDSDGGASTSTGVGDLRLAVRLGSELLNMELPVAVRFGTKTPGSDFPVDATVLPLTEGQTDWEVSLEAGESIGDLPLYVVGWAGYRWRGENSEAARQPGDERFVHLAIGGALAQFTWEIGADGLWGKAPLAQGILLEGERRRLIQLLPTVGYGVGPGRLEFTTQIPVSGKNLPYGVGMSLGYRTPWGLR